MLLPIILPGILDCHTRGKTRLRALTCMQLNRTKWCSLLFFTMARKRRKNTMRGTNWPL